MRKNPQLTKAVLNEIVQANSIEELSLDDIIDLFIQEYALNNFKPNPFSQTDPRNNEPIIYNSGRASRPHTYSLDGYLLDEKPCPICSGQTTGILDWANLSEGFTFINKNLYPVVFPYSPDDEEKYKGYRKKLIFEPQHDFAQGLHFIQWTSSLHDRDWHNMPERDCIVAMKRLAALEKKLLMKSNGFREFPEDSQGNFGFVSIIKNVGRMVGGSLAHGHQQIVLSNIMPRRVKEHLQFKRSKGLSFSAYMLKENPNDLVVCDYGVAILLVPYFMRRPFDMMLIVKDTSHAYCYELNDAEINAISKGWKDAISVIEKTMPDIGREVAYNVITHNGNDGGLYFEFLPYTQENGGLEQLGLTLCQADPYQVAKQLRGFI